MSKEIRTFKVFFFLPGIMRRIRYLMDQVCFITPSFQNHLSKVQKQYILVASFLCTSMGWVFFSDDVDYYTSISRTLLKKFIDATEKENSIIDCDICSHINITLVELNSLREFIEVFKVFKPPLKSDSLQSISWKHLYLADQIHCSLHHLNFPIQPYSSNRYGLFGDLKYYLRDLANARKDPTDFIIVCKKCKHNYTVDQPINIKCTYCSYQRWLAFKSSLYDDLE